MASLLVQLEHIPVLARSCYDISTPFLMALMAPIMQVGRGPGHHGLANPAGSGTD